MARCQTALSNGRFGVTRNASNQNVKPTGASEYDERRHSPTADVNVDKRMSREWIERERETQETERKSPIRIGSIKAT